MLSKLLGKVVDNVGDVAKRMADGKITKDEGLKEIALAVNTLEGKVVEGQTGLNMEDAKSADKFRTRWRPFCCWGMGVLAFALVVLIAVILVLVMSGTWTPDPIAIEAAVAAVAPFVDLFRALLVPLVAAIGIREGGKTFGNK